MTHDLMTLTKLKDDSIVIGVGIGLRLAIGLGLGVGLGVGLRSGLGLGLVLGLGVCLYKPTVAKADRTALSRIAD